MTRELDMECAGTEVIAAQLAEATAELEAAGSIQAALKHSFTAELEARTAEVEQVKQQCAAEVEQACLAAAAAMQQGSSQDSRELNKLQIELQSKQLCVESQATQIRQDRQQLAALEEKLRAAEHSQANTTQLLFVAKKQVSAQLARCAQLEAQQEVSRSRLLEQEQMQLNHTAELEKIERLAKADMDSFVQTAEQKVAELEDTQLLPAQQAKLELQTELEQCNKQMEELKGQLQSDRNALDAKVASLQKQAASSKSAAAAADKTAQEQAVLLSVKSQKLELAEKELRGLSDLINKMREEMAACREAEQVTQLKAARVEAEVLRLQSENNSSALTLDARQAQLDRSVEEAKQLILKDQDKSELLADSALEVQALQSKLDTLQR